MDVYTTQRRRGIARTKEFARKQLAEFAINVGTKRGHGCRYAPALAAGRRTPRCASCSIPSNCRPRT